MPSFDSWLSTAAELLRRHLAARAWPARSARTSGRRRRPRRRRPRRSPRPRSAWSATDAPRLTCTVICTMRIFAPPRSTAVNRPRQRAVVRGRAAGAVRPRGRALGTGTPRCGRGVHGGLVRARRRRAPPAPPTDPPPEDDPPPTGSVHAPISGDQRRRCRSRRRPGARVLTSTVLLADGDPPKGRDGSGLRFRLQRGRSPPR